VEDRERDKYHPPITSLREFHKADHCVNCFISHFETLILSNFFFCYIFIVSFVNGCIIHRRLLIMLVFFIGHGWEHFGNRRVNFRGQIKNVVTN
jgi:hypothetical protein